MIDIHTSKRLWVMVMRSPSLQKLTHIIFAKLMFCFSIDAQPFEASGVEGVGNGKALVSTDAVWH